MAKLLSFAILLILTGQNLKAATCAERLFDILEAHKVKHLLHQKRQLNDSLQIIDLYQYGTTYSDYYLRVKVLNNHSYNDQKARIGRIHETEAQVLLNHDGTIRKDWYLGFIVSEVATLRPTSTRYHNSSATYVDRLPGINTDN